MGPNMTVKHALNVAIDNGDGFSERDARDGRGGVASDAGKLAPGFGGAREFSFAVMGDELGGLMQPAGAMVVAKTAPQGENGLFTCFRQIMDGGKALHPARVVIEDGGDASLLEHDLGDPYWIGISRNPTIANTRQLWATRAPWEVAAMGVVPSEQRTAE